MPFKYIASWATLDVMLWLERENYQLLHSTNWELNVERPTLEKLQWLREKGYVFSAETIRKILSSNLIRQKPSLDEKVKSWSDYAYGYHYNEDAWYPPNVQLFSKYYQICGVEPNYDVLEFFNNKRDHNKFYVVVQTAVATNNFKILNWLEQKNLVSPFANSKWSTRDKPIIYLDICEDCCRFGNLAMLRHYLKSPIDPSLWSFACESSNLNLVKYLHQHSEPTICRRLMSGIINGGFHILMYMCPHLDMASEDLRYVITVDRPYDDKIATWIRNKNYRMCINWLDDPDDDFDDKDADRSG